MPGVITSLQGSKTYDLASLPNGTNATTTVTVTGAVVGDFALASLSTLTADFILIQAQVSSADTVTVNFRNTSGNVLDEASGTLRAIVFKATT